MPEEKKTPCRVRLEQPPDCSDIKSQRAWAMCWAREKGLKQGMDFGPALKQGWQEAKKSCTVPND